MTTTPEGRLKEAARKYLDAIGCWYFFPPGNGYGRAGIPDIVICWKGRFYAPELKVHPNKPSKYQEREIAGINLAGGNSFVVTWHPKIESVEACIARAFEPLFYPVISV